MIEVVLASCFGGYALGILISFPIFRKLDPESGRDAAEVASLLWFVMLPWLLWDRRK